MTETTVTMEAGLAAYKQRRFRKAAEIWSELAEEGDAEAQYSLGILYKDGIGVPQDHTKAIEWLRKAGKSGNHNAELILSVMEDSPESEM